MAAAAKAKRHTMILSNVTNFSVEEVAQTLGTPPWQQIYLQLKWDETERMVKRIESAGVSVLVLTVDVLAGRNTPTMLRFERQDTRACTACHANGPGTPIYRPMYEGMDTRHNPPDATWATLDRLRKLTKLKLVIKGLDNAEDARVAVERGVDGIVVSNHGGRSFETLRATIDCLPEVVGAVRGRIPIFIDGGIRRGTDIYKALALGATGVGIGRPSIWGLAAFGQEGVEQVLEILRTEFLIAMRQMGSPNIKAISASRIVHA
jgi:isopentenyl diphosphate isomerase/L-lactate dehydrogenase-like FMN-dependent dehydrogenase